jgi:hypothetical protein
MSVAGLRIRNCLVVHWILNFIGSPLARACKLAQSLGRAHRIGEAYTLLTAVPELLSRGIVLCPRLGSLDLTVIEVGP